MIRLILISVLFMGLAACSDSGKKGKGSSADNSQSAVKQLSESKDYSFIEDENLRTCIENTGATHAQLHSVVCAGKNVKTLSGVEALTGLRNVNVSFNQIDDLTPLASLPKLQVLYVTHNNIDDVDSLSDSSELKELALSKNNVSDVSDLYKLAKLKKLYLQSNPIDSIDSEFSKNRIIALN